MLTIIVPTYNRSFELQNLLTYFEKELITNPIIIADSSSNDNDRIVNKNKVATFNLELVYYEFPPSISLYQKLNAVLNFVKTCYVTICADDDFLIYSGVLKCINFLDENENYACAQGLFYEIGYRNDECYLYPNYFDQQSIEGENLLKRLLHFNKFSQPLIYAVHRRKVLSAAIKNLANLNINHRFLDILITMLVLVKGKSKNLPCSYNFLRATPFSAGRVLPTVEELQAKGLLEQEMDFMFSTLVASIKDEHVLTNSDEDHIKKIIHSLVFKEQRLTKERAEKEENVKKRSNKIIRSIVNFIKAVPFCFYLFRLKRILFNFQEEKTKQHYLLALYNNEKAYNSFLLIQSILKANTVNHTTTFKN